MPVLPITCGSEHCTVMESGLDCHPCAELAVGRVPICFSLMKTEDYAVASASRTVFSTAT
jgi:hypothetical protein